MYPNYFQAFFDENTLFLMKMPAMLERRGVWLYKGVSIMMKGVSPMNGENSVGVPFDSWNVSH